MLLDLAERQNNLLEIREYIIELEKSKGGSAIRLPELQLEDIQQDLIKYFDKH